MDPRATTRHMLTNSRRVLTRSVVENKLGHRFNMRSLWLMKESLCNKSLTMMQIGIYKLFNNIDVVNAKYISCTQDWGIGCSTGTHWWYLNFNFERKCAGGLLGHFARTSAGRYICLERLIVIILLRAFLILVSLHLHRLVPRGKPVWSSVLSMPFALPRA